MWEVRWEETEMRIVNYGSINLDHVYAVDHIVQPGETMLADKKEEFCGGKGLNQSLAIAKAGCPVDHAGIVGEDGEMLLAALTACHVNIDHIRHAAGASSHTVIQVDAHGQNSIIVFSGENMRPSEQDLDAILADYMPGDAIIMQNELFNSARMMEKAAAKGLKIIFNPSPANEALPSYPLDKVDWFILNEIEGEMLTGEKDAEQILNRLAARFPNASVVLTLGEKGAFLQSEGKRIYQSAFPVNAVDTTAAGDTFTGYFIAGYAFGMPYERVMKRAALAASIAVSRAGAADSVPLKEEVDRAEDALN